MFKEKLENCRTKAQNLYYEIKDTLPQIYIGWRNLILFRFGYVDAQEQEVFLWKKTVCNKSCPLYKDGIVSFCSTKKEHDGINGCGCVIDAKLWSDSPCPLGKF